MSGATQIQRFCQAYEKALAGKWKGGPESTTTHLRRRKKRGHLSQNATEAELTQKGLEILKFPDSIVYEYTPSNTLYFVVHKEWAVFFDESGLWDTVFPPDLPARYFAAM
ncbi:MAG TPA: hypothetical protein VGA99_15315, partial [bacterium]